jgi:hypothetical protein
MATLHLPKNRRKKEQPEEKLDRQLDEGLKQTFPAGDPVAATAPGGPVAADSGSNQKTTGPDRAVGA